MPSDQFGVKRYGIRSNPEDEALEIINQEIKEDRDYGEVEDLEEKLRIYKAKFLEFEKDARGNIDLMGLKRMLQELGQAKTHLELKDMIRQVDKTNTGTICYRDFVAMMCGPKPTVLRLILRFEELERGQPLPRGVAPRRDLKSLP